MAILQVRDIDDRLYEFLKTSAKLHNRSISQEVITIIEDYSNSPQRIARNATLEFLELNGSWKDDRSSDKILEDLKQNRNPSERFGESHGLFD